MTNILTGPLTTHRMVEPKRRPGWTGPKKVPSWWIDDEDATRSSMMAMGG